MTCWALLALKALDRGKTRLAAVLSPAQREALVRSMLARVIRALEASRQIAGIAIVTPETAPMAADALMLPDRGHGLNPALADGARAIAALGVDELLVLHPDLPLLGAGEIDEFVTRSRCAGIGLAPDRRSSGTNAVFLRLPAELEFCFGRSSFERHLSAARRRGCEPAVVHLRGFAFDVDDPCDLEALIDARGDRIDIDPRSPTIWAPSSNHCSILPATAHD